MKDLTAMGQSVGALLKERKHTVAVAESSAGGLISAVLVAVPGASAFFLGGGVIYTLEARRALLSLQDEALTGVRASTEEYALLWRELCGSISAPPGASAKLAPPDRPAIAMGTLPVMLVSR